MPLPTWTFQQLWYSLAIKAGLNPDPALGTVNVSAIMLASYADFLSDAVHFAWRPDTMRPELIWPFTVSFNASVTVTSQTFLLSTLANADWYRLWSADPRLYSATPTAYTIAATDDGTNVYPRTTLTPLFAFYRPARPVFTSVVPDPVRTYNVGDLVYDSQISTLTGTITATSATVPMASTTGLRVGMTVIAGGITAGTTIATIPGSTSITLSAVATGSSSGAVSMIFGTGNVFRCITSSLGSTINNTTNWTAQTIPDQLVRAVLAKGESYRVKSKGNSPEKFDAEADRFLAEERARSLPEHGPPPIWSCEFAAI